MEAQTGGGPLPEPTSIEGRYSALSSCNVGLPDTSKVIKYAEADAI